MKNYHVLQSVLGPCIIVGLLLVSCTGISTASEEIEPKNYGVPADYANLINPIAADETSLQQGEEIYTRTCIHCHGEEGHGDGPAIANQTRKPYDFRDEHIKELSDGELYYIILHGVEDSPMLDWSFLEDEERWFLVNYIRTFQE